MKPIKISWDDNAQEAQIIEGRSSKTDISILDCLNGPCSYAIEKTMSVYGEEYKELSCGYIGRSIGQILNELCGCPRSYDEDHRVGWYIPECRYKARMLDKGYLFSRLAFHWPEDLRAEFVKRVMDLGIIDGGYIDEARRETDTGKDYKVVE